MSSISWPHSRSSLGVEADTLEESKDNRAMMVLLEVVARTGNTLNRDGFCVCDRACGRGLGAGEGEADTMGDDRACDEVDAEKSMGIAGRLDLARGGCDTVCDLLDCIRASIEPIGMEGGGKNES